MGLLIKTLELGKICYNRDATFLGKITIDIFVNESRC